MNTMAPAARCRPAAAALLVLASLGAAQAQQAVLRERALVAGANVMLGDLVELTGLDAAAAARIGALAIGASPRAGAVQQLSRVVIEQRVRAQAGAAALHWTGADRVTVQRAAHSVAGADIVDEGAAYLYRRLAAPDQRVAIQPLDELPDLAVALGRVSLQARPMPYAEALRKRAKVWVDVYVDGRFERTVPVSFLVSVWREAWVSGGYVPAGDSLRCRQFERRAVDVAAAAAGSELVWPTHCEPGWRARRPLLAGEVVVADAVAPSGTLLAGDAVVLKVRGIGVMVEAPAVLLRDAPSAESAAARLRVRQADRVIEVKVSGQREVEPIRRSVAGE